MPTSIAFAQAPTVTTASVSIPTDLAPTVAALLAPEVVTVTVGSNKLEFWWVKAVPVGAEVSAPSWKDVPEGSLIGALRLTSSWTDIRGYTLRPGVYTLRFALQPQNGDHMGISPNREFLLPAPAADDRSPEAIGYDGAVSLAKKASRRPHPAAISVDPPIAATAPMSTVTTELGHHAAVISVPTAAGKPLLFGIVVDGTIEH